LRRRTGGAATGGAASGPFHVGAPAGNRSMSPRMPPHPRYGRGDGKGSSRNIYREKVTGARADRRELNRMLGKLVPGDVVTVTRIDRLARSTFDLFAIVKRIVDAKAEFRSLADRGPTAPAARGA